MGSLSIIYRKISELKPYPRNARTHSRKQVKQMAAAVQEFGFTNPVLIDENDKINDATQAPEGTRPGYASGGVRGANLRFWIGGGGGSIGGSPAFVARVRAGAEGVLRRLHFCGWGIVD